jgi:hypothetical protein
MLHVDVFPLSFGMLSDGLSSHDGFLFLPEAFYFLLDLDQLVLYYSFDFLSFLIPVLYLDLIELRVVMDDLKMQRCPQGRLVRGTSIGLGGASSSAILTGAYCNGEHVGWLWLGLWYGVKGWVLYALGDVG